MKYIPHQIYISKHVHQQECRNKLLFTFKKKSTCLEILEAIDMSGFHYQTIWIEETCYQFNIIPKKF